MYNMYICNILWIFCFCNGVFVSTHILYLDIHKFIKWTRFRRLYIHTGEGGHYIICVIPLINVHAFCELTSIKNTPPIYGNNMVSLEYFVISVAMCFTLLAWCNIIRSWFIMRCALLSFLIGIFLIPCSCMKYKLWNINLEWWMKQKG